MKVLVETLPDHQIPPIPEASVVLGDTGHMDDVFAADEAVHRVLDGRESRTGVFKQEDIITLRGIEKALESGQYDTSGTGIQVIPAQESGPLLAAMELYATIPESERSTLTDTEQHKWSMAVEAIKGVLDGEDIIELDPGVSPEDVLEEIIPSLKRHTVEPSNKNDSGYEWLYTPSDMKLNQNVPQPVRFANTTEVVEPVSGMRLFKEPPPSAAPVGVGVRELILPDVPILAKDAPDAAARPAMPQLTPEQRALSNEATSDGIPAVDHATTAAKR